MNQVAKNKSEYHRLYKRLFELIVARKVGEDETPEFDELRAKIAAIPVPKPKRPPGDVDWDEDWAIHEARQAWGYEVGKPLYSQHYYGKIEAVA